MTKKHREPTHESALKRDLMSNKYRQRVKPDNKRKAKDTVGSRDLLHEEK